MPDQKLTFNGIDARSGTYRFESLSPVELAAMITGNTPAELDPGAKQHLAELAFRRAQRSEAHFGVKAGIDPSKLEEAGYLSCEKTFAGRTPRTVYKLTTAGRRALEKYLDHMGAIIRAARNG